MGYGALSAADYFDVNPGDPNPKVYSFKWGRNGWGDVVMSYANAKPIGSSTVLPGSYGTDKNDSEGATPADCSTFSSSTTGTELVRCVGFGAIPAASSGLAAWLAASDATYTPVDIRESGEMGSDIIYNNSSAAYSLNIPYQTMFACTSGTCNNDGTSTYANLDKLNEVIPPTYVLYNKTQHTALAAAMGLRMLGVPAIGLRDGLAGWNNTVGDKWTAGVSAVMTGQSVGSMYAGTIAAAYPLNSGLNLAPTITAGPSASVTPSSATITWTTNYPATTMINDNTTSNDTVLNTSHSATLTGLSCGTSYTVNAISYDCVANKVVSPITFTTAPCQDLYVSSATAPSSASPGNTITVAGTVNKSGTGSAAASTARIYIYGDIAGTGNRFKMLGDVAVSAFGAGIGSDAISTSVTIPSWVVPGSHQIIIRADLNNVVPEWNESNNRREASITIVP